MTKCSYIRNANPVILSICSYCYPYVPCSHIRKIGLLEVVVIPLLAPEKTLVNNFPSSDTDTVKVLVLSLPLYQEISILQRDLFVPRSNVIEDPRPRLDHLVSSFPSTALVGGKLDWLPLAVIPDTDKALQEVAVETTGLDGTGKRDPEPALLYILKSIGLSKKKTRKSIMKV